VEGPTPSGGEDVEPQELSFIAGGSAKQYSHFGRLFGGFLQNKLLTWNPAIAPAGIYPNGLKAFVDTKTCTWLFVVGLFIIART